MTFIDIQPGIDTEFSVKLDNNFMTSQNVLIPIAQNAFQLVEVGAFTNRNYLYADLFNSVAGKNNTVDTASTTARYDPDTDTYQMSINDEAPGDTTHNPNSFTDPENAFDGNDATYAIKVVDATGQALGKTFGAKNVTFVKVVANVTTGSNYEIKLYSYDGGGWNFEVDVDAGSGPSGTVELFHILNKSVQGLRVLFNRASGSSTYQLMTLEYGDYNTSDNVVVNLHTLTGDEQALGVYPRITLGTSGSLGLTVGDGSTTIAANTISTAVNIDSLAAGSLTATYALGTSNTVDTPLFYGHGEAII